MGLFDWLKKSKPLPESAVAGEASIAQSEEILKRILNRNGFSFTEPTVEKAVSSVEEFVKTRFDCSSDDLLWETGTFAFGKKEMFRFSLTRQFGVPGRDEFIQLRLDIAFLPDRVNAQMNDSEWAGVDISEFFNLVRQSAAYETYAEVPACECRIYFEET